MRLKLRRLELRVATDAGLFGTRIEFADGLVILRADNSQGKSTCIQSIVYALGLEGMLSASHAVPLPHAMTDEIEDESGAVHPVLESSVLLEIENHRGDVLTIRRPVASGTEDRRLIKTWLGPKLSNPNGTYKQRDLFVRFEGAAQRREGFHFVLARFLDWELPQVTRYQGGPVPLYLECIFPLLFVEQKHGWSGIQGRMPTYYGIRDVGKRAIEFLLDLEEYRNAMVRQELEQAVAAMRADWTAEVASYVAAARTVDGVVRDLPSQPVADWPPSAPPQVLIPVDGSHVELSVMLKESAERLRQLERDEIPRVEQVADELTASLRATEGQIADQELVAGRLAEEVESEREQVEAVDVRLSALEEDLQRNRDIRRLRDLGSDVALAVSHGTCPTCHQAVADTLLEQAPHPMSVEANIAFIEEQVRTFVSMREDARRVLTVKERHREAVRRQLDDLRAQFRSQRRTLVSDGRAPSEAAIRARLQVAERVRLLRHEAKECARVLRRLGDLAAQWRSLQQRLKEASAAEMSSEDRRKLDALQRLFVQQLGTYGFSSVAATSLRISQTTYRPEHDGFDLGFDLSASDLIRTIWAYLHSLLELARTERTNQPGILILDEPRQQETARMSFAAFLRRASSAAEAGQQVIFATSEEERHLRGVLQGMPHTFLSYHGRILKRMGT